MNSIKLAALACTLAITLAAAFSGAQAADAMSPSTDTMTKPHKAMAMKHDAMKDGAMKHDAMKSDAMKDDAMKGDAMKEGSMKHDSAMAPSH